MRLSIPSSLLVACLALFAFSPRSDGKDTKKKLPPKDPQDAIDVIGHIPPIGGRVTGLFSTVHYGNYYLYLEHEDGKSVTLVDFSKVTQPVVVADLPSEPGAGWSSLYAVSGTAALMSVQNPSTPALAPQTIRIMDFSDPKQPKIAREFAGVTAMSRNDPRGFYLLANTDGVWILRPNLPEDPAAIRAQSERGPM